MLQMTQQERPALQETPQHYWETKVSNMPGNSPHCSGCELYALQPEPASKTATNTSKSAEICTTLQGYSTGDTGSVALPKDFQLQCGPAMFKGLGVI